MTDKQLQDKAINIKGKQYVLVADRIVYFNEHWPYGSITTEVLSSPEAETVVIKATVSPDQKRFFTGHSQATWDDGYINKTSALENAETSAVGRALAMMGIGVIESITSVDEINKAETRAAAKGAGSLKEAEKRFDDARISATNVREFWKEARKTGHSNDMVAAYLATLGHSQTEQIRQSEYEGALEWARKPVPMPQDLTGTLQASLEMVNAEKAVKTPANGKYDWKPFWTLCKRHGVSEGDVHRFAKEQFGVDSLTKLDPQQLNQVVNFVTDQTP